MAQNNWLDEGSTPVPQPTSAAADTSWLDEQSDVSQDNALVRGFKKSSQSIGITKGIVTGDSADTARKVAEAADYARKNPGTKEGAELMDAWNRGDGVTGGVTEVAGEFAKDWRNARGFIPGVRATAKNLQAMGSSIVEQVPNMIAPVAGMIAGGAAGSAAAGPVGTVLGGWAGTSLGNTAVEGGSMVQEALQKDKIDPTDQAAVSAYLDKNGDRILGQAGVKGAIIGAVDTATAGLGHFLLSGPGKAAASRALADMGVDVADKAAVRAAQSSAAFKNRIAADAAYQATQQGANKIARNVGAAALEPAGEFAGEFVGQGVATGEWDTKNAALEAASSIGQSGAMYAGQKAIQAFSRPGAATNDPSAQPATAPGQPPAQPPAPTQGTGPTLALPAPDRGVIQVAGDGTARTPAYQAPGYVGDVTDVEPRAVNPVREQVAAAAEQGGSLSNAALTAIDTGVSDAMQPAPEQAPPQISLEEADARDRAAYEQFFANLDAEPVVGRYVENDDDIPDFDAASNVTDEEFLRSLDPTITDQEIQDAIATSSQSAIPQSSVASNAGPQAYEPAGTREGAGEGAASQTGQVNAGAIQQAAPDAAVPGVGGAVGADGAGSAAAAVSGASGPGGAGTGATTGSGAGATEVGSARAGGRGDSNQALSAPTNLRDALVRVRQQKQEAANAQDAQAPAPAAAPVPGPAAAPAVEAAGPALNIKAITAKQIPDMTDAELQAAIEHYGPAHKRTAKLQKEAQRRAVPATTTPTTTQGNADGPQASQAQQASPQPTQAAAAPAAAAGLTDGAPTENTGAQAAPAAGAQAQAQYSEVEALRQKLRDVEAKILAAAPGSMGQGGGDIEAAMKSRKVPVTLKAQRNRLKEHLRQSQDLQQNQPPAQAQAATEQQSAPGLQFTESAYTLPSGSIGDEWRDGQKRSPEHPDFTPTPRQQLLMDAVAKALDDGAFYNDDVTDRVAKALGVSDEVLASNRTGVQGGDFGYDVYHARKAVEAQAQEAAAAKIRAELNLQAGDKLGTLIFNDFKQTNSVEVVSIAEDGRRASFKGKRGAATVTFESLIPNVKFAIERAHEKGKRKDSYEEFIAGRSANLQEGIDASQDKARQAQAATESVAQPTAPQQADNDFLPEGWTKSVNGYTKRPVYRMEQGVGQPFAVVTQTEGMTYEVQIRHGDKQLTTGTQRGALSEVLAAAEAELGRMKQADSVTHADPGEKAEAATPAVVTDSLKKAARNEDTKPSEMRKWLVAEIDKELLQAPDRPDYDEAVKRLGEKDAISMFTGNGPMGKNGETGFITFDVPGDGKYKVRNSVRGLLEFRKNVMASQGFKDSGQKRAKPEQNDGVQGGSGGSMTAIANMIEEGDFEAARDYAEAVGVARLFVSKTPKNRDALYAEQDGKLREVTYLTAEQKAQWDRFMSDGTLPTPPDTKPQTAPKTAAQLDEEKRQAAEAEEKRPKDTGWNMAGTGYGGKRYIGRNITLDDGREVVARVYENADTYEEAEVKVDGVRKFAVTDRENAQDKADAFIKTLTAGDDAPSQVVERAATPSAAIPEGYKPAGEPFYRGGKQIQGYAPFAPGERVTMKESAGQSGVVESLASPDDSGVFASAVVKFDNGMEQMVQLGRLEAAAAQPDTPKLTPAEAKSLMAWEDLGQKGGVKTHALTFYESQADKDAKRGRMIVAKVSKEVDSGNWTVEGTGEKLAVLGMAKKKAEQFGMEKAVADGFVAEDNPFAEYNALAKQYGYEVRPDGAIGSGGKFPGPTMRVKGGRLRIESGSGDLLASYAGTSPDGLGKFLESFWYAEKKADGFVEQGKPAPANDRNAFTLQRLNRDTDQMEPVTFERGEYVRYAVGGKDQFGDIDGISQARKEFSVDGLWYPFGFAYKAERPAAPKADTVPLSSVIDKVNAKNGQGLTDADRVPEQKPASKTPTVDRHNAIMAAVREGKATPEQFQSSFEQVVSNKDAIVAELDTMTKVQLLREGGPFVQMRYANEKKAEVVDAVYRQIVGEYALGESVTYSMGKGAFEAAVRKMVEATDADKLARYVTDRKAAVEEMQARRAAKAAAIENPQTLGDFREVLNAKIREGMTRKEAFLTLTPQQRIQYDTLEAESTREASENRKRAQKTEVRAAGQTTAGEIVATKHTRDGYDLFVVKLADRLSKEDYSTVLASAKKLGGWYSAFRGNGAIPGFQFKDKANAEAFLALAGGDTTAAQEQVAQRRDAFEDDRSQTAVERLRAMADKLEEGAAEVEGQQRKTNTERRARFASAAMASAAADKAKAQTMRNIARAIEGGEAKFLDAVRTKSQVDMLTGIVDTAKGAELRAKYPSYADQEKRKGEPPTAETADFADFPSYSAFRSDLATLGRQLLEVDGTKKLGQRLMSVADDVTDAYLEFAKANIQQVSQFGRGDALADFASKEEAERAIKRSGLTGKAIVLPIKRGQNRVILSPSEAIGRGLWQGDGDKRITLTAEFGAELVEAIGRRGNKQNQLSVPWQFQNAYDRRKALSRIGIETPSEFRAALREFIGLKEQAVANRTRAMELQMVGRKADGLDFFPTSAEVADQMIEAADLSPDMAVLEPSAGMGHLADRIREAGAEPDVIEISADRRELLEEKGYTTQAVDDFLDLKPREFYTFGDTFRAPDGAEGIMRGANGNRVRLVNQAGDMVGAGYYDRADLTGVAHNGTASGYDRIIMNPPFSNRRDAEHVRHAYSLLKPGGRIVAIMGEGVFFGQDKKAQDFREWLESVGGTSEKLPEGSFMDPSLPVNTSVNARMVVIDKPATEGGNTAMFSRSPSTKSAYEARIDALFAGEKAAGPNQGARVLDRSDVLGLLGFGDGPVNLAEGKVIKGQENHPRMTSEQWKKVPEWLDNPAAVFDSDTVPGALVLIAPETINGATVRMTVEPRKGGGADVHILTNAYDAPGFTPFARWFREGLGRLIDQKKFPAVLGDSGLQLSSSTWQNKPGMRKILTEKHLDGYRRANNPAAFMGQPTPPADSNARNVATRLLIDGLKAKWTRAPEIIVARNMQDTQIPQEVRDYDALLKSQGATGEPRGFIYKGKVYLLSDQLKGPQQIAEVLFHEVLGHYGLRGAFGDSLNSILQQMGTMRRRDVVAKAREYGLFNKDALGGLDKAAASDSQIWAAMSNKQRLDAAEEVLAEMAQTQPTIGFVQRAIAAIRNWLRANVPGFKNLKLTDADIVQAYILPARGYVTRSQETGAQSLERAMRDAGFSRAPVGDQTQTENFRRWFGDSKAVDADGRPGRDTNAGMATNEVVGKNQGGRSADDISPGASFDAQAAFEKHGGTGDIDESTDITAKSQAFADMAEAEGYTVIGRGDKYVTIKKSFGQDADGYAKTAIIKVRISDHSNVNRGNHFGETDINIAPDDGYSRDTFADALRKIQSAYVNDDLDTVIPSEPTASGLSDAAGDSGLRFRSADIGNNGNFDPEDDRINFSRAGMADLASKARDELNRTFTAPGKLSWWHKTVGTMYNLAERSPAFKRVFDSAQGFVDDVSYYATDAAEQAPRLLPKLETWRDIFKRPITAADNAAVAKPVFEGTLVWTRDEAGKPVRVDDLVAAAEKLTAEEKARRLLRQDKISAGMLRAWQGLPLEQYEKLVESRYESQILKAGIVWTPAELKSMFKLTDAQVELYQEFRAATDRSIDTMARSDMLRFGGKDVADLRDMVMDAKDAQDAAQILRDHLQMLAKEDPGRAGELSQLSSGMLDRAAKVQELQEQGYAPLSRFGEYTVDVVDANGERQYFGLFETQREANIMAMKMRKGFGQDAVSQGTLSNEEFKLLAGITPESLELFGNMLGLDSTGDDAQDQAFQEYLRRTKTNRSAMRRLIHRQGIAGYSEDVGRVLASFIYSNARQTSAGLHMGELGEAVTAIPKQQGELKDAAVQLSEYVKNPQEEAQAIRGLLFAQYLGGSIASAVVNMSQPAAVTFPWLSQFGGAKQAAAELGRAAKNLANKAHRYEADLAAALKHAEEEGTVSPQEVHQLMAQARGSGSLRPGDGTRVGDARATAGNALTRLSLAWGKVFGAAEQVNRRMTFIAAYRVAKAQGMANPAAFAKKAVIETQFTYSKANKMKWGRGAVGATVMTFKTYSVAYLELLGRMWSQGGPEGKRAVLLALGMLMLMGGAGGLPFAEDAEDLVDGLAQLAGYNFNSKKAKQELLESVFGQAGAGFVERGITGLPGMPLDVSGRLGMGNLLPGTGIFKEKTDYTRDVLEVVGPVGDLAKRAASGARSILAGDVGAGLLQIAPAAVRNAAKGADMAATGMYRDDKGYKVLDTSPAEAAMKAIGFQPASVAKVQEANFINQQAKNFYNMQAQEIRAKWARGIFEKSPELIAEARADLEEWNRKNPEQRIVVSMPAVLKRVREMSKTKDQRIADTAPKAMRQQLREEAAKARATL